MYDLHALDDAAHDGAFVGGGVDEREEEVHREPVAELARGASSGLVARGSEVRPHAFGAEGVRDDRERAVVRLLDPNALLERRHDAFAEELAEVRGVAAKRPEAKRGGGGGVCGVRVMIRGWYVRFRVGVLVARSLGDGGEGFVEAREGVGGAGEVPASVFASASSRRASASASSARRSTRRDRSRASRRAARKRAAALARATSSSRVAASDAAHHPPGAAATRGSSEVGGLDGEVAEGGASVTSASAVATARWREEVADAEDKAATGETGSPSAFAAATRTSRRERAASPSSRSIACCRASRLSSAPSGTNAARA